MLAGLTAGSVAAVIAVLVSLPLRSPSDTLLNSASVALACLLAGLAAGLLWLAAGRTPRSTVYFLAAWTVLFVPAAIAVVLFGRSQLDHFVGFAAPLAAIVYVVTGALTVAIPRCLPRLRWWQAGIAVAVALVIGVGLVNQTDQESGRLELPPPGSQAVPVEPSVSPETRAI
ncbi:MAG: hypothetical protein OXR67_02590 [Chloroflexota bacterium]|nr:hypothetical protein [Chloroflexota bacterium]